MSRSADGCQTGATYSLYGFSFGLLGDLGFEVIEVSSTACIFTGTTFLIVAL